MLFDLARPLDPWRRWASSVGLALLVLSPLFFFRPLEDAYVLPQRAIALFGLSLAFGGLGRQALGRSSILWGGLLYFSWRYFSHCLNPPAVGVWPWLAEQVPLLAAFLLAALAGRDPHWEQRLWRLAALSAVLVAAYALFAYAGLDPGEQGSVDLGFLHRAHGSLGNPDFLAGFLVLFLAAFALDWLRGYAERGQLWSLARLGLLLTVLFLTQVRAAWLAGALSLALALWLARAGIRWGGLGWMLGLGLALFGVSNLPGLQARADLSPWARLKATGTDQSAWAGRRFMTRVGWNLFKTHPIIGVGPGHFQQAYLEEQGRLLGQAEFKAEPYRFTADIHQDWVQVAAETGLPGLVLLLWLWLKAFEVSLSKARARWQGAAMAGLLVAFGVQACFHFPFNIQASALTFWMGLGLLSAWQENGDGEGPTRSWAWLAVPLGLALLFTLRQAVASANLNTGTWLKEQQRPAQALPYFERTSSLWPQDARAWLRLGIVQDSLGKDEAAVESFGRAKQQSPALPEVWANLSLALAKLQSWEAAQASAEQALSLNPRAGEVWSNLAKIRYLQGDQNGALQDLQSGLVQAGPSAVLFFNLGALHFNAGRRSQAKDAWAACLKLEPGHSEAARMLKLLSRDR